MEVPYFGTLQLKSDLYGPFGKYYKQLWIAARGENQMPVLLSWSGHGKGISYTRQAVLDALGTEFTFQDTGHGEVELLYKGAVLVRFKNHVALGALRKDDHLLIGSFECELEPPQPEALTQSILNRAFDLTLLRMGDVEESKMVGGYIQVPSARLVAGDWFPMAVPSGTILLHQFRPEFAEWGEIWVRLELFGHYGISQHPRFVKETYHLSNLSSLPANAKQWDDYESTREEVDVMGENTSTEKYTFYTDTVCFSMNFAEGKVGVLAKADDGNYPGIENIEWKTLPDNLPHIRRQTV